jgi:cell division protein FtsB
MLAQFRKIERPNKSKFLNIFGFGFFIIIIGFLVVSNIKLSERRDQIGLQTRILKNEIQILEQEKEKLQAQVSQTKLESYLEKEARERFNLKKPGEQVVAFVKEKSEQKQETEQEKGFWDKIFGIFKF